MCMKVHEKKKTYGCDLKLLEVCNNYLLIEQS